jgi:hypothetical protein
LREELLRAARENDATPGDRDEYGERYISTSAWLAAIAEPWFAARGSSVVPTPFPD